MGGWANIGGSFALFLAVGNAGLACNCNCGEKVVEAGCTEPCTSQRCGVYLSSITMARRTPLFCPKSAQAGEEQAVVGWRIESPFLIFPCFRHRHRLPLSHLCQRCSPWFNCVPPLAARSGAVAPPMPTSAPPHVDDSPIGTRERVKSGVYMDVVVPGVRGGAIQPQPASARLPALSRQSCAVAATVLFHVGTVGQTIQRGGLSMCHTLIPDWDIPNPALCSNRRRAKAVIRSTSRCECLAAAHTLSHTANYRLTGHLVAPHMRSLVPPSLHRPHHH